MKKQRKRTFLLSKTSVSNPEIVSLPIILPTPINAGAPEATRGGIPASIAKLKRWITTTKKVVNPKKYMEYISQKVGVAIDSKTFQSRPFFSVLSRLLCFGRFFFLSIRHQVLVFWIAS